MTDGRLRFLAIVLACAIAFGTTPTAQARPFEDLFDYYDGSWTVLVGYQYFLCNDSIVIWGYQSSARMWTRTDCVTGTGWTKCQQLVGGAWQNVQCPF